jgi:Uma2 family endonuclease
MVRSMATVEPQPERMTAAEFEAAFGESEREDRAPGTDLELVDGGVVEGEMPNRRHQIVLHRLENLLEPWARAKGGGTWANPELRLGEHDVRQPDLIAWWSGQPVPMDGQMHAVPDLIVEVLSPRPRDVIRDREEKLAQYCAFGVPHYWTVEPIHRVFETYLRKQVRTSDGKQGWRYDRMLLATSGTVTPLVGPALLDLDALWRDLD